MIGQCQASRVLIKFEPWGDVGVVEVGPWTGFSSRIISETHFQATPLAGGYATVDDCVGGWGGFGLGSSL